MFTISSGERFCSGRVQPSAGIWDMIDENGVRLLYADKSTRPEELSTRMTCLSEGTRAD